MKLQLSPNKKSNVFQEPLPFRGAYELFTDETEEMRLASKSQEGDKSAHGGMDIATLALNGLSKLGPGYMGLIIQYSQYSHAFVHLKSSIIKESLKRKCYIKYRTKVLH